MNRADRKRWQAARSLADLCDLTARWLEGDLKQTPGHAGPPCPETIGLIPVLAAANRAGFLTDDSQPGVPWDESESCQYAAVTGFVADENLDALRESLDLVELLFIEHRAVRRTICKDSVTVTVDGGEDFTRYGQQISRKALKWQFEMCQPSAVQAVCDAWQVTIVEMEPGRNSVLWPALAEFAGVTQRPPEVYVKW